MSSDIRASWRSIIIPLASLVFVLAAAPAVAEDAAKRLKEDKFWNAELREALYGDREIIESDEVIELTAPKRAEDPAVVPISIAAKIPQSADRRIETVTLLIDRNPVPFSARFKFGPQSGRADLAMRIRVNAYTPVRAIAETSDGVLHMSRRFIKASGGCSAPPGTDLATAKKRMGKMKMTADGDLLANEPLIAQLRISHPNITGMQMDQVSRLYIPPHFVKHIEVSYNGEPVMTAETDIAISENPSFRFYFLPEGPGTLEAKVVDSKGLEFTNSYELGS